MYGKRVRDKEKYQEQTPIRTMSLVGDLQDGRGVRHGDHLPPHKYLKNTSTCGTTPMEHLLNAGRRPQTSQKQETPHVPG